MRVRNRSGSERIFLSLGSNVGRRPDNLRKALGLLLLDPDIRVVRVSRLYRTLPVGYTDQREFLNGAVELRSRLEPRDLLRRLGEFEMRMGKCTPFRNGPRLIDIDLLLYGDRVIRGRRLQVPHPRMHLRRFVLEPLVELAPRILHPVRHRTAARLLGELGTGQRVLPWGGWVGTDRFRRGGRT
jgi:2-amino-4-hydroxy-6-hydroxymethyldihydropteridine diphosphokinase